MSRANCSRGGTERQGGRRSAHRDLIKEMTVLNGVVRQKKRGEKKRENKYLEIQLR